MDYADLRTKMVQEQIIARGISNPRVIKAFQKVRRHKFVPEDLKASAYADHPLPIGQGQTISQPYMVALMTECLDLSGNEKVLEIGTGSGYQTAILAELTKEIYTIERFAPLAERAAEILRELDYLNIKIKIGDGTLGWLQEAPFDRILITAATDTIPPPLEEQLKEGGKMVLPLGAGFTQALTIVKKAKGKLIYQENCACVFVPLIGRYAYSKERF
jgi:protein-L-isoaspartate(D-aspartate) O-methyltransferase